MSNPRRVKGGDDMDYKTMTPAQKAEYFTKQLEDIRKAKAVLEQFETLTQGWLKRVASAEKKG